MTALAGLMESDRPERWPAGYELGRICLALGDETKAEKAFRFAAQAPDAWIASAASLLLAHILLDRGEREEALAAFRLAAERGTGEIAGRAGHQLGELLEYDGDLDGAREAYRSAVAAGPFDRFGCAAFDLGLLQVKAGDVRSAVASFRAAVESGLPDILGKATLRLASTLACLLDDREAALEVYERALSGGDAQTVAGANYQLARLTEEDGDQPKARELYRRAIEVGNDVYSVFAAYDLGVMEETADRAAAAAEAYRIAIASTGDLRPRYRAALALARATARAGDLGTALPLLRLAATARDDDVAAEAAQVLAYCLRKQRGSRRPAAGSGAEAPGRPDRVQAVLALSDELRQAGELVAARAALGLLGGSESPGTGSLRALRTAALLHESGELDAAAPLYEEVLAGADPDLAPEAAVGLGLLRQDQDRPEAARDAFRFAIDSGHPVQAKRARHALRHVHG
jgi:tetratricopeptide (TPR) repeat protein